MCKAAFAIICLVFANSGSASAQHAHHHPKPAAKTPYAGQDERASKSLSPDDIRQLLAGGGWGLAKPAELGGYPGPRHVLDLAKELALTPEQTQRIERIFQAMNNAARQLGKKYIAAERALSEAFGNRNIDPPRLARLVANSGALHAELRRVHLVAHLETTPLLNQHQRMVYQRLRGYTSAPRDHTPSHQAPK